MVETLPALPEISEPSLGEQRLEQHVLAVAQSSHFVRAETLRKLLLYLWAHRDQDLSEYAVATEALGRRSDFDPKTDASVRVQISRLRRKLKDFYETEGLGESHQLQIPMGTHTLTVLETFAPPPNPPPILILQTEPQLTLAEPYRNHPLLVALCAVLLVACSTLLWLHRKDANAPHRATQQPTSFWASFISPGTPVKIILPTPVFFNYPKLPQLHVRDVYVNDFASWQQSELLKSFQPTGGNPTLDRAYTVTSDTLAAIDLSHYLDRSGLADQVAFQVTADGSMNVLEQSSVIAFGAHSTLHPFRDYLASMNFSLAQHEAWVDNAHPAPGENARYPVLQQAVGIKIEPALVAVLPGRAPTTKLLIMQAIHTSALVELLTSKVGNSLFEKMYREHGSPAYFEMVVNSEVAGDHVLRSWPVAMHAYTGSAPSGAEVTQ